MKTSASAEPRILVVVPVYNHAQTLRHVVHEALSVCADVLVVDDGSQDMPRPGDIDAMRKTPAAAFSPDHPLHGLPVYFTRHTNNRGKGQAILTAADLGRRLGMTHIITIDADAQHNPLELPLFIKAVHAEPLTLFVGKRNFNTPNVPSSSRFGRSFSNFWFKVQTENALGDTQCGFRAYPLAVLECLSFTESRYSFEIEVLVRAAWAGFAVKDVPISVHYPPRGERVSHFKPFMDNARLSLLNTRLTIRAIMPVPQKRFTGDEHGRITPLHPLRSLRMLLTRNETPQNIASSAALGVILGTLPLIGLHSILIILAAGTLKRNKLAGLAASQLCMPPLVPALCMETGYYLRHGSLLTDISWQTLGHEGLQRLGDWVLGSLVLAPIFGLLCGTLVYVLAVLLRLGLLGKPTATSARSLSATAALEHGNADQVETDYD